LNHCRYERWASRILYANAPPMAGEKSNAQSESRHAFHSRLAHSPSSGPLHPTGRAGPGCRLSAQSRRRPARVGLARGGTQPRSSRPARRLDLLSARGPGPGLRPYGGRGTGRDRGADRPLHSRCGGHGRALGGAREHHLCHRGGEQTRPVSARTAHYRRSGHKSRRRVHALRRQGENKRRAQRRRTGKNLRCRL
jgi:hypothetical protein